MNGENKGIYREICFKLGIFKHPLQDTFDSSRCYINKQSRTIFCLKSIFYGLIIFYSLFALTNRVSAYDLFNNPSSYSDVNIKSIEDFITDYNIDTTLDNDLSYYLNNYSHFIIIPYELNDTQYFLLHKTISSNNTFYILDDSYDNNYSRYNDYPLGFSCSTFNSNCAGNFTNISLSNYSENPYIIRNTNYSLDNNTLYYHYNTNSSSTYSFSDTIYTDYEHIYYLDSEGDSIDLLTLNNNSEPSEPTNTTEPTNTIEPNESSDDFVLTNNLLYYISFMCTLGVLYTMIRNTFSRRD